MIQYAVSIGRADWSNYWSEIPASDFEAIQALRRFEAVGHEREDWRAAVVSFAMQSALAGGDNGNERFEQLLALIQHRDPQEEEVSGQQAAAMIRSLSGGKRR